MSAAALATALAAVGDALAEPGAAWRLREETDADRAFVDAVYIAIRWDELAAIPWPDTAKRDFLRDQSRLQADHYRRNYPGAALCVVERDGIPVGRFYLYASPSEFRLMDIAKPPPAYRLQRLPAGWGILVDDLVAGVYAAFALQVLRLWH